MTNLSTDESGYGRGPQSYRADLVEVGPKTAGGEYLRRYWHPVAVLAEIGDRPKKIRVLGEDLILFRDGAGRLGLLHSRCAHRGCSLYYGRIEKEGLRCCYHGWMFDVQGHCLEQPCEPNGGTQRHNVRQPWYPVREQYGMAFAYMGPLAKMPALPRYDNLENLNPGDHLFPTCDAGTAAYSDAAVKDPVIPYNWFQWWENGVDHYHVWILHQTFSFPQFDGRLNGKPEVEFRQTDVGVAYHALRTVDGRSINRVGECVLPNVQIIPGDDMQEHSGRARSVSWGVPVDDTSFVVYRVWVGATLNRRMESIAMTPDGKTWSQMSESEHQAYPGDFEAQASQGTITLHSEEHLVQSDLGLIALRRMVLAQVAAVRNGKDPIEIAVDADGALVKVAAGNFWL